MTEFSREQNKRSTSRVYHTQKKISKPHDMGNACVWGAR